MDRLAKGYNFIGTAMSDQDRWIIGADLIDGRNLLVNDEQFFLIGYYRVIFVNRIPFPELKCRINIGLVQYRFIFWIDRYIVPVKKI